MNSRKISKESSTARKHAVLLALSLLLFFVCFRFGLILAESKPIWNDEFYSQLANVQGLSYGKMMAGQVNEGNNAPLFYLIQKVICDIASYQAPEAWVKGDWGYSDYYSRILLRVSPVFFMSLAAVFIFYYFSRVYSIFTYQIIAYRQDIKFCSQETIHGIFGCRDDRFIFIKRSIEKYRHS